MSTDALVDLLNETLLEYGLGHPGSFHSWRCSYPDRYGECDCVAQLSAELARAIRRRRFSLPVLTLAEEERSITEETRRLAEEGRRLANWRDELIADGFDPAMLDIPIHPDDATPDTTGGDSSGER